MDVVTNRKFVEEEYLNGLVWELLKPDLAHQKHPFSISNMQKLAY